MKTFVYVRFRMCLRPRPAFPSVGLHPRPGDLAIPPGRLAHRRGDPDHACPGDRTATRHVATRHVATRGGANESVGWIDAEIIMGQRDVAWPRVRVSTVGMPNRWFSELHYFHDYFQ